MWGTTDKTRKAGAVSKEIIKKYNGTVGKLMPTIVRGVQEWADAYYSDDFSYQLAVKGKFACHCCCGKGDAQRKVDEEWDSVREVTPSDLDPDDKGEQGWNRKLPFPTSPSDQKKLDEILAKTKIELLVKNWKKCMSKCGKTPPGMEYEE